MKTLILVAGLLALSGGCKREELPPKPTEINMVVVDEARKPIANAEVLIQGLTGSYFGGTRRDSTFARLYTKIDGMIVYKAVVEDKWRVYAMPFSPYDSTGKIIYDLVKFEGTIDGIVNVGQVNNITVIMRKR